MLGKSLVSWTSKNQNSVALCRHENVSGTRASQKGLLDGAGDPPGFNAGMIDPAYSSRDVSVNLTLQLIRRESLSVI